MTFDVELPEEVDFTSTGSRTVAISPDGSRIVFVANDQLWMRLIGDLVPTPIAGTEGASTPFFSPDGQQIGFSARDEARLKRVAITGGAPVVLGSVDRVYGASWADDGMIYFAQGPEGIWRVPGTGGTPKLVIETQDDEAVHGPQLLPGGEWLPFTLARAARGGWNEASIVAQSLVTERRVVLIEGGKEGRWVPTGHLVYVLEGTLLALTFDPDVVEPPSGPVPMVEDVRSGGGGTGAAQYEFSETGTLVYVPGTADLAETYELVWVDRDGQVERLPFEPRDSRYVDLSPDGQHIALEITGNDGQSNIWIYEAERGGGQVLLTTEGHNRFPVWSADGDWVFFGSDRGGNYDIWKRRADRSTDPELVLDMQVPVVPTTISADGKMLLFDNGSPPSDVGILVLDSDQEPEMLVATPALEFATEFSPDGRFFTFHSNETGQFEQYVREVASGRTFPISTSVRGGAHGRWSQDGSEIYYLAASGILMAEVRMEPFSASEPVEISGIRRRFRSNFDVAPDGQRFLVTTFPGGDASDPATPTPRIRVILNWFEELKQRAPTGR